ncbi:PAC2 family protein [Candidatus Woesearchaeota archaeon]|nr:PAC2 family protein [Candidatus Woesearchaeota archaeon]
MTEWKINHETKEKIKLHQPIMIEGLPGIGNVGKIAVDFLIEELKAKKLCSFFSYKFPHSVFIGEDNLVEMPKLEMYYKSFSGEKGKNKKNTSGKGKRDLILLTGDIQPIDEESCYRFCEEVLNIAKEYKCTEVVTTGGIGLQNIPEKPKVYCTSNDAQLLKSYTKNGLSVEKEIYGIVGPIMGVSGILLSMGKRMDVKAVSLLAQTFGHPMYLGIKGAKELLKVIDLKFNYGIDLKKMSKEIIEVEKQLMQKTKALTSEVSKSQAGAKAGTREVGYIG